MKEENASQQTREQTRQEERHEKDKLCTKLADTFEALGILPHTLDLRELRSVNTVVETIHAMVEDRNKFLRKADNVKFTQDRIAERSGISRGRIAHSELLQKIISACIPKKDTKMESGTDIKNTNPDSDLDTETICALRKKYQREERSGEMLTLKIRIAKLEHDIKEYERQAELEKTVRLKREEHIKSLEKENQSLIEQLNLLNPAVQAKLAGTATLNSKLTDLTKS